MERTQIRTRLGGVTDNRSAMLAIQVGIGIALVALGVTAWGQRRSNPARRRRPMRDYSGRSGFPLGVEASRGAAKDAAIPKDMLTPDPLRPFTSPAL